ncbi:hypothetical protein [Klebsiella variicola]|uniref:hypothetical protein n=1 Tax=Klebsiella variicola TaxID=244366 RepID=UPI00115BD903|nr:hypothetical protein [Klebsiella variicola]
MEEAVELSIPHIYKHELRFVHNGKWVSILHPRDKISRILMKSRYVFGDGEYTKSTYYIAEKLYPGFNEIPEDDRRDYVWWKDKWTPYEKCSLELFIAKCRAK